MSTSNRYIRGKDGKFLGSLPAEPNLDTTKLVKVPALPREVIESIKSPDKIEYNKVKIASLDDPNRKAQYFEKENDVLGLFKEGSVVEFAGRSFVVKTSDKPFAQSNKGEPKTDVYILLEDRMSGESKEIKISYKSENYQFLENKMNKDRFEAIFNTEEREIITALLPVNERVDRKFEIAESDLLNEETRMTLGYRLDIMAADASGYMPIPVSEETMAEILSGGKLDESKRNGVIHGEVVKNSGVAEFILVGDKFESATEALSKMVPIKDYVKDPATRIIGLAPKAVNLIPSKAKDFGGDKIKPWDGNRPLAIAIKWEKKNGKFIGSPDTTKPLFNSWASMVGESLLARVKKTVESANPAS